MCGIAGWANFDSNASTRFGDEAVLHSMCDTMRHRGPDSKGTWLGNGIALGMQRLAIIDLDTGDQPFWNTQKSVVVIMNGEIYNFRELRKELQGKGYNFKTQSDTEVIPHLYDEYGVDFPKKLNGMFAIALWDLEKKQLVITRDRFGEKPLYYGIFGDKILFASEPKVLLSHPEVSADLDFDALNHYLSYDYVPAPLSAFKGISKLPAAHTLAWKNGKKTIDEYWKLSFKKRAKPPSEVEAANELDNLIANSTRMRLVSDVPLGVLLSGGIDSSTVAAYAQSQSDQKIKTFSIGFEEDSFDESKYAREVANHLKTDHHEDILSVAEARDLIDDIGKWLDEPLADASLLPTFLLSRFVRENVTVALGGDGGDEIFAGYPMYLGHKVSRFYNSIPEFFRNRLIEPIVNRIPTKTSNLSFDYKAKRFVAAAKFDQMTRHHSWFGSFQVSEKPFLFSNDLSDQFERDDIYDGARKTLSKSDAENYIERMQYVDMKYYLAEDILTKVDRASMAVSLEVRAPFLDHRIAEYTASLPQNYKLKRTTSKYILKKTVGSLLPKSIINRPKKGFGIPVAEWLKGPLNPLLNDLLSEKRLKNQNLFDPDYIRLLILDHEKGESNNYKQLWNLLVFQLWYDNFLKTK